MPVSLPASEATVYGIDIDLPIGQVAIGRGIGISNAPGTNPLLNTTTAGFFGVLVEPVSANTTGAIRSVRVPACVHGLVEVQLGASGVNRGTPLTLDAVNRFVLAGAGQKVYGRAQKAALAGAFVLALIHNEGTL